MRIALVEPFFSGSHRRWAEGYAASSRHHIDILSLPGRHWKWRMHGGAIPLAQQFLELPRPPDLVLATDMLDLNVFLGLSRWRGPTAVYFHENQLTYPWSPHDTDTAVGRDRHFQFINIASALAADRVFHNSDFHRRSFLDAIPEFVRTMPDCRPDHAAAAIAAKSQTLPLGMDLRALDAHAAETGPQDPPLLLWNHRWEYDKNPEGFFRALFATDAPCQVAVLGEQHRQAPAIFAEARERLGDRVAHWGHAPDAADYARWLWRADLLPVTSNQDFFGGSVVEAMYCRTTPLLPRRLAYPEHTSDPRCFYDGEEFASRLDAWLRDPRRIDCRHEVAHYDWKVQAPRYDTAMENVR